MDFSAMRVGDFHLDLIVAFEIDAGIVPVNCGLLVGAYDMVVGTTGRVCSVIADSLRAIVGEMADFVASVTLRLALLLRAGS